MVVSRGLKAKKDWGELVTARPGLNKKPPRLQDL